MKAGEKSVNEAATMVLNSVSKNIVSAMNGSDVENDANRRAAKRAPLKYANRKQQIMYNGKPLPE